MPLLYWGISFACQVGTRNECKTAGFIPGHNLAGEGFDIVTLKRKGAYVIDTKKWQEKDGTCTLCMNSLLEQPIHQKIPLSVKDWRVQTECKRKLSSSVYESSSALLESSSSIVNNDWRVGLDITPNPNSEMKMVMAGSHSRLADFSMSKSRQDKYSFTSHELYCSYYRYRLSEKPQLTKEFYRVLKRLPKTYDTNTKSQYRQVIDTFGTHFIKQVNLGGRVKDVTAIRTCEASVEGLTVDEVKDCLELEASATIGDKGKGETTAKLCKELTKKKDFKGSFHETFNERESEITGGDASTSIDILFSDGQDASVFGKWMESLKTSPDIISYSLEPIHRLLRFRGPQQNNLRKAVSDYILQRSLQNNCSNSCPTGSTPSRHDPCACTCHAGHGIDSMCCSKDRGLAKVSVNINDATGLWGDYSTATDAYVKVLFEGKELRTPVIWNNNNPRWNVHFDLGFVKLTQHSSVTVEVWDEDNKYDDDLLGKCDEHIISGTHSKACYLTHGSINFDISVTCGPHLGGKTCQEYVSSPKPSYMNFTLFLRK
ncbi:perforin-1 [Latimeria chalumnae]|uniref:perforin-1 n=1 Tax=Latimeria chalumnae TaxID=7897 RepID=UPI0006D934C5|nr:PREDICTED: perforin-1 [Latimeria chalumnae]|eukprot:XP_006007847.2 PREDICTED: perforin-1 [Latimeria chalumnae]